MSDVEIVFDIGATNLRIATVEHGLLRDIRKVPTPQDPIEAVAVLSGLIAERGSVKAVAGCTPGDLTGGVLGDLPNLPAWEGFAFGAVLGKRFSIPITLDNDAVFAGLGEALYGAGTGYAVVAYVTVSTGVGGARIVDGAVDRAARDGFSVGGVIVDGAELGSLVSGNAVRTRFGADPSELASDIRNSLADELGQGLAVVAHTWKPDVLVLGGSMMLGKNPIPVERVQAALPDIVIKKAALGDDSGLYGALVSLAKN